MIFIASAPNTLKYNSQRLSKAERFVRECFWLQCYDQNAPREAYGKQIKRWNTYIPHAFGKFVDAYMHHLMDESTGLRSFIPATTGVGP
jgi:hypothetical protein